MCVKCIIIIKVTVIFFFQLLDLMHTLHTSTADIYRWWAEENPNTDIISLWSHGWCPLLQGIASLCCDHRRDVSKPNYFTNVYIFISYNFISYNYTMHYTI